MSQDIVADASKERLIVKSCENCNNRNKQSQSDNYVKCNVWCISFHRHSCWEVAQKCKDYDGEQRQ